MPGSSMAIDSKRDDHEARRAKYLQDASSDKYPENLPPNINNVIIRDTGLYTVTRTIPEISKTDIKTRFNIKMLTPIEGKPTYESMIKCERELRRNALAIEVSFGAGEQGHVGVVHSNPHS